MATKKRNPTRNPMDTAPRDGTTIEMRGHIDTHTREKRWRQGLFHAESQTWMTTTGWILFPDYWRPLTTGQ